MKQLTYLILISALAVLMIVPTAGAQQEDPGVVTVSIQDGFFDPADVSVAPGTTVTWVNEGNFPHAVTADNGLFDSGVLYPEDSYSVWFDGSGTVTYHCAPSMTGSVTVG
jgi:plastocyanin